MSDRPSHIVRSAEVEVLAHAAIFDERGYLAANPDVARAVLDGLCPSGRAHFDRFGAREGRKQANVALVAELRHAKAARLRPLLDRSMDFVERDGKFDFLTQELRDVARNGAPGPVSSNGYDGHVQALIAACEDGLVIDCGAGRRPVYYENVVTFEIADYDTTDVLGVGERLPFVNNAFQGAISVAVLEHVRDPFRCAAEIVRVLRPGGRLICAVPFLQPEHGYPNHYYNMAPQGLRALFEGPLVVDDHQVLDSTAPIWALQWIATRWAEALPDRERRRFLDLRLRDLLRAPTELVNAPWSRALPERSRFELASATVLFAHKPG